MVTIDPPAASVLPIKTALPVTPAQSLETAVTPTAPATLDDTAALPELTPEDQNNVELHRAAAFEPVAYTPISPAIAKPTAADTPISGVLKGDALTQRISELRQAAARRLIEASYARETLRENLRNAGPRSSESLTQLVDAYNRADHTVKSMSELLKVLKSDTEFEDIQKYLKDSAIDEASGKSIDTDGVYGPQSDDILRERIRKPDVTYVDPSLPKDPFVYQKGEIGVDGGTRMEAQANCGPASMAMVIEANGGDAPTMKDLREDVNAPTGNADDTYGLDTDQVTKGIKETLAEQGIQVETTVDIFSSKQSDEVLQTMRDRLAAGDDVILLTSNMGSGGVTGHYVVVKEVRADGSFVVDDPQKIDGANTVQTADDLVAAMRRRGHDRDTRVISVHKVDES